jgi:hypothetical protein
MWSRLSFWLITAFFITMNVLLWRWEFGGHNQIGSTIPVESVWHKILLAPDNSRLEIRHHGKKIGYGAWQAAVGEELATGKHMIEEPLPEGMVREPSGYSLDFGGNFSIDNLTRLRFEFVLRLTTNHQWQEFSLNLTVRPSVWEVHASALTETVKFSSSDEAGHNEHVFTFSELQHPEKIARQAGFPFSSTIFAALGLPGNAAQATPATFALKWQAHNDWLTIAGERMRIYRLQARLLDRFQIVVLVSLEGEILRVELPDEILLINDQLTIL